VKAIALGGDKRMTVKEVAAALGSAESTIRNKAAELFPDSVRNGFATLLTEEQVVGIKQAIVPRDLTLKSKVEAATTDLEMKQKAAEVMAWLMADRESLREQVAELAPKAEVAERIAGAIGLKTLSEVGKINGVGPHRIFTELEARKVIYRTASGDPLPYQQHIEAGRFVVRERTYRDQNGAEHLRSQVYVTGKGEVWLAGLLTPEAVS